MCKDKYTIDIKGIQFYGYHGVFEEEQKLGQKFEIDARIEVKPYKTPIEDNPENILSYVDIINNISASFHAQKFKLIESIALEILKNLGKFKSIIYASIRVKKPNPPIPVQLTHTAVEFEKTY